MSWRNQPDHRSETETVKKVLIRAGYQNVKVGHRTHGWLSIHVDIPRPEDCRCKEQPHGLCPSCSRLYEHHERCILRLTLQVTGREGDYDGRMAIHINLVPEVERGIDK